MNINLLILFVSSRPEAASSDVKLSTNHKSFNLFNKDMSTYHTDLLIQIFVLFLQVTVRLCLCDKVTTGLSDRATNTSCSSDRTKERHSVQSPQKRHFHKLAAIFVLTGNNNLFCDSGRTEAELVQSRDIMLEIRQLVNS